MSHTIPPPHTHSLSSKPSCDYLILGTSSSGKTYLIKQLKSLALSREHSHFETIPSIGVNLDEFKLLPYTNQNATHLPLSMLSNNAPNNKQKFIFKEVGGSLTSTWHRYTLDCYCIVYCMDASQFLYLSQSIIELMRLLHYRKPILCILTKSDMPNRVSTDMWKRLARFDEMQQVTRLEVTGSGETNSGRRTQEKRSGSVPMVEFIEVSAYTGEGMTDLAYLMREMYHRGITGRNSRS